MNNITNEQKAKALAVLDKMKDSKLETHLNACVRCGLCADSPRPQRCGAASVWTMHAVWRRQAAR